MNLRLPAALVLLGAPGLQGAAPDPSAPEAQAGTQSEAEAQAQAESGLTTLYEGALLGAMDGAPFAETPGYRSLLEIVARYGEEELERKAQRQLDFAAVMAEPEAWRGQLVRLRGLLAGIEAVRLARPIGERVDVFRATVIEADGSEGVIVDFLAQPPELEVQWDVVEVQGIFFRTVSYENELGKAQQAPLIIARNLRPLDTTVSRRPVFGGIEAILIGAAVAFLIVRILLSMRRKRGNERADAARASRMIRERARASATQSPPPSTKAP